MENCIFVNCQQLENYANCKNIFCMYDNNDNIFYKSCSDTTISKVKELLKDIFKDKFDDNNITTKVGTNIYCNAKPSDINIPIDNTILITYYDKDLVDNIMALI